MLKNVESKQKWLQAFILKTYSQNFGAGGGSRTHTVLPPRDFKSRASAIPPHQHLKTSSPILKHNSDLAWSLFAIMEVPPGFEPGNKGFADLCLTAWRWYHYGAEDGIRTRDIYLGKVTLYH